MSAQRVGLELGVLRVLTDWHAEFDEVASAVLAELGKFMFSAGEADL